MQDISNADIYKILAERHAIAIIWNIEDVLSVRPDLTEDEAWEVLRVSEDKHDANFGINWDWLESTAQTLFGRPPEGSPSVATEDDD